MHFLSLGSVKQACRWLHRTGGAFDLLQFHQNKNHQRGFKMKALITCVSAQLWQEAAERLRFRVEELKRTLKCDEVIVSWDENGLEKSPCTTQLWHEGVRTEHDEYTCYFKHWFKKTDGKLQVCRFSHLAMMKLVRSCVWQGLLAEFVTGRLLNRDAVRLRVEDELEHYSNLNDRETIRKIGTLAQDFFGVVKNHLGATWRPLNRAGLGAAERIVVNMPGYDCRSKRKGWSDRKARREIAQQIVDAGLAELPTRGEQEAFVWRWIGANDRLKQGAAGAILKLLCRYYDAETGEVVIRPWQKEELSEIRREARERGTFESTMNRAQALREKLLRGETLTRAETCFKSRHKELFEACPEPKRGRKPAKSAEIKQNSEKIIVAEQTANGKRKHSYKLHFDVQQLPGNPGRQQTNQPFPAGTYGETGLICNKGGRK